MHWTEIQGWFQWRSAQEDAARSFPSGSCFVEVGIYMGRSLCSLAEVVSLSGKNSKVIGVDNCQGSGLEGNRREDRHGAMVQQGGGTLAGMLHKNIIDCGYSDKITMIVADSLAASQLFRDDSLEWVHLDARHDYDSVKADIRAWLPKVKPGGWLSGDDYDEVKWPSVVMAVNNVLPEAKPWASQQWRFLVGEKGNKTSRRLLRLPRFL